MPFDTPIHDLVRQLRRAGLRPPERLVERILSAGQGARGALLELALDHAALLEDEPVCWGPIHALRLLGELRDPTLVEPLLSQFPVPIEYDQQPAPVMWTTDASQILGRIGAPAVDMLWAWFDDAEHNLASRSAAADALAYATVADAELREQIIAGMHQRLVETDDRVVAAFCVGALARMAVAESYPDVMAAYRAGRVETGIIAAGDARQLLLGKGTPNLACVNHSLWERYDQHGPFAPEE